MKRRPAAIVAVLVLAVGGFVWATRSTSSEATTAAVTIGDFEDTVQVRGTVQAERSVPIVAPASAGALRIVEIVNTGQAVRKGEVLVRFDSSTVARTVAEKQTELNALDAEIAKVASDTRTKIEAAAIAEVQARFAFERARLDVSGEDDPTISKVVTEKARLTMRDKQQALELASASLATARAAAAADLAAVRQRRAKAQRDLDLARAQHAVLELRAPADGYVSVSTNWSAGFNGRQPFKEGDRAWPGAQIAELPDAHSLIVTARVDELDRARISDGQAVSMRVDAVPERALAGRVRAVSPLAKADLTMWPPTRTFELRVALRDPDPRLRPGMTAAVRIHIETLRHVLLVPAQAVVARNGSDVVYRAGRSVERIPIKVLRRGTDRVAVAGGLAPGDRVALRAPADERAAR